MPIRHGQVPERAARHNRTSPRDECVLHGLPRARRSAARDDLHNLQPVARVEQAMGESRRGHSFAVVLDHYAARRESLRDQKGLDRAGQRALDWLSVGEDDSEASRCLRQRAS